MSKAGQGSSKLGEAIEDPQKLNSGSSTYKNLKEAIQAGSSAKEPTRNDKIFHALMGIGIVGALIAGIARLFMR